MLPVGVIREHTRPEYLAWRMGLYLVGGGRLLLTPTSRRAAEAWPR